MVTELDQSLDFINSMTAEDLDSMTDEEREVMMVILRELSETGTSSTLDDLWYADYEEIPVTIDEFLDNDHYLGATGRSLYPAWRVHLKEIFESGKTIDECILSGAIGLGKSTIACIGLCYSLYKLLCLRNPQEYYGLVSSSKIAIVFINVTLTQSYGVAYAKMQGMLLDSPWFRDHGTVVVNSTTDAETFIPDKGIFLVVGSKAQHVIGMDVFCMDGSTEIHTTDGLRTMESLGESGGFFKALQYDTSTDSISTSDETKIVPVRYVDELLELEFDDGSKVRCTPEHKFLVKSGTFHKYVKASDLDETHDIIMKGVI